MFLFLSMCKNVIKLCRLILGENILGGIKIK